MGRSTRQQSEETAELLIETAVKLFAAHGYAGVGLEVIAAQAGVTRGAVYHHFDSKAGLFTAVLGRVQRDVGERVAEAAAQASSDWAGLVAGCHAFMRAGSDPRVHRIMLIDAPAVVGWQQWMEMDAAHSKRMLEESLQQLEREGLIAPHQAAPAAQLLSGAMNEAVLWIARSTNPEADLRAASAVLDTLLDSLCTATPAGP